LFVYKYKTSSFHGENIGSNPIRDNLAYNYYGYFESQVKRVFWFTWKFDHLKKDAKEKKTSIIFLEKSISLFVV